MEKIFIVSIVFIVAGILTWKVWKMFKGDTSGCFCSHAEECASKKGCK